MNLNDVDLDQKLDEPNNQPDSAQETAPEAVSEQKTPTAQAVLDLSKAEKFQIEGKDWSYEDLKKSLLRQEDYTKKTQALAKEREEIQREQGFRENLQADIAALKRNPALVSEFQKIYPKHYHWVLDQLGLAKKEESQSVQAELPREVLERLQEVDSLKQAFGEQEKEKFNAKLESIEHGLQSKYKRASLTDVYGAADAFFKENNVKPNQVDEKMLEPFFKASHEFNLSQYKAWQQEELKQTKEANGKASDVGKGGGTPGQAPRKLRLKDVEDEIVASENW